MPVRRCAVGLTLLPCLPVVVIVIVVVLIGVLQVTPRVVNKVPQDKTLDENELQHGDIILFQIRPPKVCEVHLSTIFASLFQRVRLLVAVLSSKLLRVSAVVVMVW